mmetsp:Transcript_11477/g.26144  ORF Transcript_11477/g.26144 Transcript_11477/m.26144 type:complete len:249 (-) Transcript_11477:2250-2996(-)
MGIFQKLSCFSSGKSKRQRRRERRNEADKPGRPSAATSGASPTITLGKTSSDVTSSPSSMDFSIGLAPSRSDVLIDDSSLPTMDSDYNQHAPGACSLSDAGGTLGSQSQALTNFSTGQHTFGSPFGVGSAAGDSVEKRMYQHHVYHSYSPSKMNAATQREEMLEITAPAGKLGVVIDTPSLSAVPIVHAIKDSCPIRYDIKVGDKLVAVDDVDVREYTSLDVSRLISRKSDQKSRKLTIIRSIKNGVF